MFRRIISAVVCLSFIASNCQPVLAQGFNIAQLPVPGTMVGVSASFTPLAIKGLVVDPQKPLEFQFIIDTGKGPQDTPAIKEEADRLVKYFLAGLTIPEGDLWVNLSPYEKDRMVPEALGQTDLGRDLLAQDYILKQLTATLIYPEKELGKEFWAKVYQKAQEKFGTTDIPVNTFNKVWILPDQAQVFENKNAAYVTKSTLKVMLDEDYIAKAKHLGIAGDPKAGIQNGIASQIIREIVIPEIEKEVNTGKNFAPLRQMYQALILAKWYKETVKNGLLEAVYLNKNKTTGVNLDDPAIKQEIYERYLQAYKKGVFNYIKDTDTPNGVSGPRKYFSGGLTPMPKRVRHDGIQADVKADGAMMGVKVNLENPKDMAMASAKKVQSNKLILSEDAQILTILGSILGVGIGGALFILSSEARAVIQATAFDPNSFKLALLGSGLVTALIVWQSYSIKGLSALLEKGSMDDQEVIRRLKNKGKDTVPALINILERSESKKLSTVLISILGKIGDQRATEPIIAKLYKDWFDVELFKTINDALRNLGVDREIILQGNLKLLSSSRLDLDGRGDVKGFLSLLVDIGSKEAIDPIAQLISGGRVDSNANEALEKLGADRNIILAANLSALNTTAGRGGAIYYLGNHGDSRAIGPIADIVAQGKEFFQDANWALKKLGADREIVFQANLKALNSNYGKIQLMAAQNLAELGDKRAVEPIAIILNAAEIAKDYEKYNQVANFLNKLEDSRGKQVYVGENVFDGMRPNEVAVKTGPEGHDYKLEIQGETATYITVWKKVPRDSAIHKLSEYEKAGQYSDYNNLSDLLHKMGSSEGDYIYDDQGEAGPDQWPGGGAGWNSNWVKIRRDSAMLGQSPMLATMAAVQEFSASDIDQIAEFAKAHGGITIAAVGAGIGALIFGRRMARKRFEDKVSQLSVTNEVLREEARQFFLKRFDGVIADLKSDSSAKRLIAINILEKLHDKRAIPYLWEGLRDVHDSKLDPRPNEVGPKIAMARALLMLGDQGPRAWLEERLQSMSPSYAPTSQADTSYDRSYVGSGGWIIEIRSYTIYHNENADYNAILHILGLFGNGDSIAVLKKELMRVPQNVVRGTVEYVGEEEDKGYDPILPGPNPQFVLLNDTIDKIESRLKGGDVDQAQVSDVGGIDLNQINLNREGKPVVVRFDPAQLNQLMQGGFEGFMPVIINIAPIQSPLPLLGING